jgi:hypothetical protein
LRYRIRAANLSQVSDTELALSLMLRLALLSGGVAVQDSDDPVNIGNQRSGLNDFPGQKFSLMVQFGCSMVRFGTTQKDGRNQSQKARQEARDQ